MSHRLVCLCVPFACGLGSPGSSVTGRSARNSRAWLPTATLNWPLGLPWLVAMRASRMLGPMPGAGHKWVRDGVVACGPVRVYVFVRVCVLVRVRVGVHISVSAQRVCKC